MDIEGRTPEHDGDFEGLVGFVTWSKVPKCSFKKQKAREVVVIQWLLFSFAASYFCIFSHIANPSDRYNFSIVPIVLTAV